ncbi:hypothetical protein VFPFJ_06991 [Purpureocillium lilacinum]|uniref:Uncharacterized protein n=1 Tax=Purpureocillium lilacinum TaxID=33203 RepID=A0A179HDR6_PURLI|nr:hypothetical protein VFPFJ_06991 [Purpureocillium lilacinum]OAQ80071.1 hypothetical protein VFPBJ_05656 [Purpureocillium lilacinum]OAQ88526.1 hypothetical protein VFPFJ_06991 [Purpureocillium lilacinum]
MRIGPRQFLTATRTRSPALHPSSASLSAAHPRSSAVAIVATPPSPHQQRRLRQIRGATIGRAAPCGRNMASDEDYMAFLDKANKDLDEGKAHAQKQQQEGGGSKSQFKAMDSGAQAPKAISDVCQSEVYVSDADEPFEAVSLKYSGDDLPDESKFVRQAHPPLEPGRGRDRDHGPAGLGLGRAVREGHRRGAGGEPGQRRAGVSRDEGCDAGRVLGRDAGGGPDRRREGAGRGELRDENAYASARNHGRWRRGDYIKSRSGETYRTIASVEGIDMASSLHYACQVLQAYYHELSARHSRPASGVAQFL